MNFFLLLGILTVLTSCNGQAKNNKSNSGILNEQTTIEKPTNQLSKHLWYVFQDTRSNYWFSSNGEGVYRFDGKTIVNFTTKDGLANDTIRQIQEDKFGNIFISTFGGINKFDGKIFTSLQPSKCLTQINVYHFLRNFY
jgi:ligand-binding sensor domain-containing protein